MAQMNISSTLYNDTSEGVIAFAEQLRQQLISWNEYPHVIEELGQDRPNLQNDLNTLFLSVYEKFLTFLNDADATSSAINTWKEIERFLADYTDTGTLKDIVDQLNANIESRLSVVLENSTGSSTTNGMSQKAITDALGTKQDTITDLEAIRSGVTKVGYYECSTQGSDADKVISADNYILSTGGSMKVKMTNANTADNATLNINSTGAKALYYDGKRASASNTWEAGETVEIYYDGTSFYANNVAGGSGSGDGAFDVSVKYPTSGVEGGNTYTLDGALAVLNANLSASKKKGGMSIKFIQSSDNNYVQFRYIPDDATTVATFIDTNNWQEYADSATLQKKLVTDYYLKIENILPDGYTQLKSITGNTNLTRIDTGIICADDLEIECTFKDSGWAAYGSFFGRYTDENTNTIRLIYTNTNNNKGYVGFNTKGSLSATVSGVIPNAKHHVIFNKSNFIIDGVTTAITTTTQGTAQDGTIIINGANLTAGTGERTITWYNFVIRKNNVVVFDGKPCRRLSDGAIGMYDTVNSQFLQNAIDNSSVFIGGSENSEQLISVDKVDDEPTAGSDNLVKSGGVAEKINIQDIYNLTSSTGVSNNKRINVSGLSIGDAITTVSSANSKVMKVPVIANKACYLKFKGSNYRTQYERAWVLTDSDKKIQSWCDETTIDSINNPIVLTPVVDGFVYISIHPEDVQYGAEVDVIKSDSVKEAIDNSVELLEGEMNDAIEAEEENIKDKINYTKKYTLSNARNNYRVNVSGLSIGSTIATAYSSGSKLLTVPVKNGKKVSLKFKGTNYSLPYGRGWVLTDTDKKILSWSEETSFDYTENPLILIPSADGYIYVSVKPDNVQYGAEVVVVIYETVQEVIDNTTETLEAEIENATKIKLSILIPDVIYALPGLQLNLWNDNVSLSSDKGLSSPTNYRVEWQCTKGFVTNRCFRFNPSVSDIGDLSCTCKIYQNDSDVLIDSKTFTIRTLSNDAILTAKRTVLFGDSIGANTARQVYNNFNNSGVFSGTIPQMLGTMGTTPKYEAVGGYAWSTWATAGRPAFRIFVSNIGPLSLGAIYKDSNNHYFSVREVNLTAGTGNVLLIQSALGYGTLVMPTGTLTKYSGTGDDTISYTDAYQESANPLWNSNTEQLDFANYRTQHLELGANDKIDAVFFQLGGNSSGGTVENERQYILALYDAFIADNPNGKFVVVNTCIQGTNDTDGAGDNYGATFNLIEYHRRTYDMSLLYTSLLQDETRPNFRLVTPRFFVDRYYGFPFRTRDISSRCSETEKYHVNYLHPVDGGYQQIADELMPGYIAVLTE